MGRVIKVLFHMHQDLIKFLHSCGTWKAIPNFFLYRKLINFVCVMLRRFFLSPKLTCPLAWGEAECPIGGTWL